MFDFRMSVRENFASFRDEATGRVVFVDSFDNHEFNVRLGTFDESTELGVIVADSSDALNSQLRELVAAHT
ncbi:hypothetical protein KY49_742 [Burkholderia sp. MSHR3999]|uniref:hypothetical protein n=1 Tax=Burkholderia sp. MSHR3999 TaxID=1542965 RepID=UPI0005AC4DD6|nr:hypothetical protein [Burkholderia sp. MSHR3999]KIP13079.1 hypothetical protein KY49_742 [Burkholderia sp. MSHR3999]